MKHVIVYWSRYGNGKKLVEHLSKVLVERGDETTVLTTKEADPASLPDADMYVFSAAQEMMNLQKNMRKFMKNIKGLEGRSYGLINTHQMDEKNSLPKMEKMLSKAGMVKIASMDFKIGKNAKNAQGLPDGWEKTVEEFTEKLSASR
jgi:flavodoxin